MSSRPHYNFDWDEDKALLNERKHAIAFEAAKTVFQDPLSVTLFNGDNGSSEERWAVVGMTDGGVLVVVVHTFEERESQAHVRIISARKTTLRERQVYETGSGSNSIQEPAVTDEYEMKEEYDFSKGERGKFYRANATVSFPIYLDVDVLAHFMACAKSKGITTTALLNDMLRHQMEAGAAAERR